MRFRLRPVSESRVEADEEGTMMPFPVVNDCCCTEDDDSPRVDELRDVVGRVTGGLSAKASPTMRATANRPATATLRSRFKAFEIVC